MTTTIIITWIALSIVAGAVASAKDRSGFGYFALSILLSPLIGLIAAAAMPSLKPTVAALAAGPAPTPETHVKCPDCRELVLKDARKCKHCGCTLTPEPEATQEQLLAHHGIKFRDGAYEIRGRRFFKADEAIRHAQQLSA